MIDREFVSIAQGPMHMRCAAPDARCCCSIRLRQLARAIPLMEALPSAGSDADLIAGDTLGIGDSTAPAPEVPDIAYFADAVRRAMDALGLEQGDLHGSHTEAWIACELAASCSERVRRIVSQGISDFDPATRAKRLEAYAPAVDPDDYERQFVAAFNCVRDQSLPAPTSCVIPNTG